MTGSQLTSVLNALDRGELESWADLCEFALSTDSFLASVYRTRIDRVAQADYVVSPSEFGDQRTAELAAEFIDEQIQRVENWAQFTRNALHGIFPGYSCNEMIWARDNARKLNIVERIEYRHGHRFRMGRQYDLRLYDRGRRRGDDSYGEVLDPRRWVVHMHQEQAGYPTVGGVMRSIMWPWLFRRWTEKGWILFIEKFGHPVVSASVPPNTPESVRDQIRSDLENMSYDHVEVFEYGVNVNVDSTASQGSNDVHDKYMRAKREEISMAVLGIADAVEPGAHGSQAAVSTRAGAAMDPRMVSDGDAFADTLRGTFFKQSIALNDSVRLFGVPFAEVPLPYYRLKTADDEVVVDQADKQEELRDEQAAGESIEVRGEPEDDDSMSAEDVASMQGLVMAAAKKDLPPESVRLMLCAAFPKRPPETWDAVLAPLAPKPEPPRKVAKAKDSRQLDMFPKARAPKGATSGARTTSQTQSALPSPIELALRGELVDRGS